MMNFKSNSFWYYLHDIRHSSKLDIKNDSLNAMEYKCWNCNKEVASTCGIQRVKNNNSNNLNAYIYICPNCGAPHIIDFENKSCLNSIELEKIKQLPKNIQDCYEEIGICYSKNCFLACGMLMRNLIMRIAIDNGADNNEKFIYYVNYLDSEGITTKKSKKIVEEIRKLGNKFNHDVIDINSIKKEDMDNFIKYLILVLKNNYEFAD